MICILCCYRLSFGQELFFDNFAGDYHWCTGSNWHDLRQVPTSSDIAVVDFNDGVVDVACDNICGSVEIGRSASGVIVNADSGKIEIVAAPGGDGSLWIAKNPNSSGTLNINGSTVTAELYMFAGYSGTGTVNITSGLLSAVGWISIGQNAGSVGTINISGGTVDGYKLVGWAGDGYYIQTGGVSIGQIDVGFFGSGGYGKLELSGGTIIDSVINVGAGAAGEFLISDGVVTGQSSVVNFGTGVNDNYGLVTMTGGTIDIGMVKSDSNSTGIFEMSAGYMDVNDLMLRSINKSRFIQTGGDLTIGSAVTVGQDGSAVKDNGLRLNGGICHANNFDIQAGSAVDLTRGELVCDEANQASIQQLFDSNSITTYGGFGVLTSSASRGDVSFTAEAYGDIATPSDGYVNFDDLVILIDNWLGTDADADINNDSIVNFLDFAFIAGAWKL